MLGHAHPAACKHLGNGFAGLGPADVGLSWQAAAVSDWLGWRFVWWPRLHLSNAEPAAAWLQQAELRCSEMESDSDLSASESFRPLRGVGSRTTTNNPSSADTSGQDASSDDPDASSDPAAAGFHYSDNYSDFVPSATVNPVLNRF